MCISIDRSHALSHTRHLFLSILLYDDIIGFFHVLCALTISLSLYDRWIYPTLRIYQVAVPTEKKFDENL